MAARQFAFDKRDGHGGKGRLADERRVEAHDFLDLRRQLSAPPLQPRLRLHRHGHLVDIGAGPRRLDRHGFFGHTCQVRHHERQIAQGLIGAEHEGGAVLQRQPLAQRHDLRRRQQFAAGDGAVALGDRYADRGSGEVPHRVLRIPVGAVAQQVVRFDGEGRLRVLSRVARDRHGVDVEILRR